MKTNSWEIYCNVGKDQYIGSKSPSNPKLHRWRKKKSIPGLIFERVKKTKNREKLLKEPIKKIIFNRAMVTLRANLSIQWKPEDDRMMNSNVLEEKTAIF